MEIKTKKVQEEFDKAMNKIAPIFFSELGLTNAKKYITGLLGPSERKNGWQLSEYMGEETPYKLQQFIYRGRYDADKLRDASREYIAEEIGDPEGVLVVDDTGFIKQGKKSCGVKRQYSGTAGKIENCQIGVFLTYSSQKGHAPIDRRLYIPEEWMNDAERLKEANVPDTLTFKTKPQMGLEMIQEATKAGMPYQWVTGDCAYGDYRDIRQWLENNGKYYVMCVSGKEYIWENFSQVTVASVLKRLPEDGWFEASCGDGSKGAKVFDWMAFEIESYGRPEGFKRMMLVRRSKSDKTDIRAHICYAPINTPNEKLIEIAGTRWTIETCFKESKGEVGLDQYEVRNYDGWYKHITFAMIALALLTVFSAHSLDGKSLQAHEPGNKSLDEFKKGRHLRV